MHVIISWFNQEQLRKRICNIGSWHHWKQRLKISKIADLKSDLSNTDEEVAPQDPKVLRAFVWWGTGTNVDPKDDVSFYNT